MSVLLNFATILLFIMPMEFHLMVDRTHLDEMKKVCEHAYTCYHDMVIVCGKSVREARTFMDLCDLYEYSCEYNLVFRHVKDEPGVCPNVADLG